MAIVKAARRTTLGDEDGETIMLICFRFSFQEKMRRGVMGDGSLCDISVEVQALWGRYFLSL